MNQVSTLHPDTNGNGTNGVHTGFWGPSKCNESRLIISKIVLENFKSYGGIQEIGPLHHCFTAVVGPNGSGKSNVIEAILFVFGRRANKLRQKTIADLIHKSDIYPNCNFCKVSVYFQRIINISEDGSKYDVLPEDQFIISRMAFVDRSPEYQIDNKKSTADEIYKLLKNEHGVDLDNNRFLILQGEVEKISMMDRKGLLDYLEEIIGSNSYVEPIELVTEELSRLTTERASQLDTLRVVEKDKNATEVEKIRAEEYLFKMKTLCDKKAIGYSSHLLKVKDILELRISKRDDRQKKLAELVNKHAQSKTEKEELEKIVEVQTRTLEDLVRNFEIQKEKSKELDEKHLKYQDNLKDIEKSEGKLDKTIQTSNNIIKTKDKEKLMAIEENERLKESNTFYEKELEEKIAHLQALKQKLSSKLAPIQEELSAKQRDLIPFQKERVEVESKLALKKSEIEKLIKEASEADQAFQGAQEHLQEVERERENMNSAYGKSKKHLERQESEVKGYENQLNALKVREKEFSDIIIEGKSKLEEANKSTRMNKLINQIKSYLPKEYSNQVLGRLGDLGSIDAKYDIAASTASNALHNIVVTTSEVAQKCVQILRQYKLGRVTFIVLSEIRPKMSSEMIPEGTQRLVDLINFDSEQVKPAFYFAFRDTLVCNSLERARDVSLDKKKRRRVVTTNGDLFEVHGTLTGGGTHKSSGYIKLSSQNGGNPSINSVQLSDLDREKLQKKVTESVKKLEQTRKEIFELEKILATNRQTRRQLIQDLNVLQVKLDNCNAQIEDENLRLSSLKSNLQSACQRHDKSVSILKEEISELELKHSNILNDSKSLEKDIELKKIELQKASGKEIVDLEADCKIMASDLKKHQNQIIKNEVTIESADKAIKKAQEAVKKSLEMKKQARDEIEGVEHDMKELVMEKKAISEVIKKFSQDHEKLQLELRKCQDKLEEHDHQTSEEYSLIKDMEGSLTKLNFKVEEAQEGLKKLEKKLANVAEDKRQTQISEDDKDIEIHILSESELEGIDLKENEIEINRIDEELSNAHFSREVIEIFREKNSIYQREQENYNKINADWDRKREELLDLQTKRLNQFMAGFTIINKKLQEMYRMITSQSGSAELECSSDPFSEGISFSVRPPNKTWKNIQHLSGGEKTLSSLSLVFALHYFKPTPIYIMDEIDAALDFKNVSIVANYIKEKTKNAQFIIISLRNYMFELADRLVGVYKIDNVTKNVCIDPNNFCLSFS